MALHCPYPNCYPQDRECQAGYTPFSSCPHLTGEQSGGPAEGVPPSQEELDGRRVSWTGLAMGVDDLAPLVGRSRVLLLGLIGLHNAGKTTFLALLYSLLRAGQPLAGYRFAGSTTLAGWELIASYLTFDGKQNQVRFPPHTSRNAGRVPGLLHLALRDEAGRLRDILFTDAPGEWFNDWRTQERSPNAEGAAWVYAHGDGFLLFADSEELTGEHRNTSRAALEMVADRLVANLGNRPLGLVWTKSDITVTRPVVREKLRAYLAAKQAQRYAEFAVSVMLKASKTGQQTARKGGRAGQPPVPAVSNEGHHQVLAAVTWLLATLDGEPGLPRPAVQREATTDLFLLRRTTGT